MNLETAIGKEICFGCGKEVDSVIIMNKKLTKKVAKQVKEIHNQIIGFFEKLCDTCTNYTKQGVILIGVIEEKTEDMNNPFRSGSMCVIKVEAFQRIFNKEIPEKRIALIENEVGRQIGLWK